jgi:hypothetical protein
VALFDNFVANHPGAIAAIEGPNEINNFPITYNGLTGANAAIAFQNDFYAAAKADPALRDVPIYSFTLGAGAIPTGGYDAVSIHPYSHWGKQPWAIEQKALGAAPSGAGVEFTELGFSTLPSNSEWGVDKLTQAKLTLNAILDAKALGVQNVYLYEHLDAYADPLGTKVVNHFGLFDINNNPKPAAVALHNLTTILSDTGAGAASFTPSALPYTLSNLPATGSSLLLEKSNGAYDIVVWNEPQIWNSTTHSEIANASTNVTVSLGARYAEVDVFDPLSGSAPIRVLHNVSQFTVAVKDHPVIVEIEPNAPSVSSLFDHALIV